MTEMYKERKVLKKYLEIKITSFPCHITQRRSKLASPKSFSLLSFSESKNSIHKQRIARTEWPTKSWILYKL